MDNSFKKFDMHEKPIKMRPYILPFLWIAVWFNLLFRKHKIVRENFKKIEGGCLVVSNHMSFEDMKLLIKFLCPRRSFFVASIDEFVGKEWIMRRLGCLPKKVHYADMALVRNIVRLLKKGNIVSIYPEATYSFAGVTNHIDQGLGKLAKMANVPVIVIRQNGNYIYSPRWNTLPKNKEVPLLFNSRMVVTQEEVATLTADQIQQRINEYFDYNDYKYQRENNIRLSNKSMAHNIHRILYKCPNCLKDEQIVGEGNDIICKCCGSVYHIDELSILKNVNGETKFDSISDWYLWQRDFVKESIENNTYDITFPVKISRLLNSKLGFNHNFAKGTARQTNKGIVIDGIINENNEPFHFEYNEKLNSTIHLTFDVKGCQESAFEVHDANETYLVYPLDSTPIVKIRFAVEEAHINYSKSLRKTK